MFLEGLFEVIGMLFADKFDPEVVNDKSECDRTPSVLVKTWRELALMVACVLEACLE